jgi:hypothetical protein
MSEFGVSPTNRTSAYQQQGVSLTLFTYSGVTLTSSVDKK